MYHFIIDSATLQPYISGERPLSELSASVAAHVATLRDWQALHAVTHRPATTFGELDRRSQAIYQALAAALPGCTVYATGSRVKGSWRSGAPSDPKTAIATRLGKPVESDFDVIVLGADGERGSLWDGPAFRQAVTPVAKSFGVRIDRQPATLQPQIPIPKAEAHLTLTRREPHRREETGIMNEQMRSKTEAHLFEQMRSKTEE